MNDNSLDQKNIKNQTISSMNDDPFNLINTVFEGLKPMRQAKNIFDYAQELVYEHGEFTQDSYSVLLKDIPKDDKHELVRLYIESLDRDIEDALFGGDTSINNLLICALLSLLKNDNDFNRNHFVNVALNNVIRYYAHDLQRLLDEAGNDLFLNLNEEQGIFQQCDDGDYYMGKY